MKKVICFIAFLFLSLTFIVSSPVKEDSHSFCGTWIVTQNAKEDYVKLRLLRDGISQSHELYSFYLSNGVKSLNKETEDTHLLLNLDMTGEYIKNGSSSKFTFSVSEETRHLVLSNKRVWKDDIVAGTFNEDYTRLYFDDGIYLEKED